MSADDKQFNFNAADASSPANNSACVNDLNAVSHKEPEESRPEQRRQISLILLIVLVASLVIVLLANSGLINRTANTEIVYQPAAEPKNEMHEVKAELAKVIEDLNEINRNPDLKDDHLEVKEAAVKPAAKPVVVIPVPAVPVAAKPKKAVSKPEKKVAVKKIAPVVAVIPPVKTPPVPVVAPVAVKQPAYIKHDIKGNTVDDSDEQWACVLDTKNRLMWEVKSTENPVRNPNNLYSWFDPDNKSLSGVTDGGRCKGGTDCDTHAYVKAMNEQSFCGHNDWRLPTRDEMMGLVHFENSKDKVKINTSYFPEALPSWYWTASSNESRPEFAWYVLFKNGMSLNDLKENPKHIRLVRSESAS